MSVRRFIRRSIRRSVTHESCKSAVIDQNYWQYERGRILCRVYGLVSANTGTPGASRYFYSLGVVRCLVAEALSELGHLFQASGHNEDEFVIIEDKDRVGHLHIHKLQVQAQVFPSSLCELITYFLPS